MNYERKISNQADLDGLYKVVDTFPEQKRAELRLKPYHQDMFGRIVDIPPFGELRDNWIKGINLKTTRAGIDQQIAMRREIGYPCFAIDYMDHAGVDCQHAFSFEPYPEPTYWEYRWLNPNNAYIHEHIRDMLDWKRVELKPHHQGDIMNAVMELQAFRGTDDKRLYQLRRVYCNYVEEALD